MLFFNGGRVRPGVTQPLVPRGRDLDLGVVEFEGRVGAEDAAPAVWVGVAAVVELPVGVA